MGMLGGMEGGIVEERRRGIVRSMESGGRGGGGALGAEGAGGELEVKRLSASWRRENVAFPLQ